MKHFRHENDFRAVVTVLILSLLISSSFSETLDQNDKIKPIYKTDNVLNRFGSLLGSGRSSAFPFGAGFILSIINENIWDVSTKGFEEIFNIPKSSMGKAYTNILNQMKKDEKTTLSTIVYQNNNSAEMPSSYEKLEPFDIELIELDWENNYWIDMNQKISNDTNGKLVGELIPTTYGRIFDSDTEAAIVNSFHYKDTWKHEWNRKDNKSFGFGEEYGNFAESRGEFLISEEDDFTAVAVPLKDDKRSVVFVLPTYNLTKYFRGDDQVVLPQKWVKTSLKLRIPQMNFIKMDQYGKEFHQLGINETFCTTIHDKRGMLPFYLGPVVQSNYIDLNPEFFEIASATGTAIEKSIMRRITDNKAKDKEQSRMDILFDDILISGGVNEAEPGNSNEADITVATEIPVESSTEKNSDEDFEGNYKEITFDRPFLWYLEDNEVGPIVFGFVNNLAEVNPVKEIVNPTETFDWKKEISILFNWSCKSFIQIPPKSNKNQL